MYLVMNGRKLEELRQEKGMSKQQRRAAAGISRGTLRTAVREEPVRVKTARKVGEALEVNPRTIAQPYHTADELPAMRAVAAEVVLSPHA